MKLTPPPNHAISFEICRGNYREVVRRNNKHDSMWERIQYFESLGFRFDEPQVDTLHEAIDRARQNYFGQNPCAEILLDRYDRDLERLINPPRELREFRGLRPIRLLDEAVSVRRPAEIQLPREIPAAEWELTNLNRIVIGDDATREDWANAVQALSQSGEPGIMVDVRPQGDPIYIPNRWDDDATGTFISPEDMQAYIDNYHVAVHTLNEPVTVRDGEVLQVSYTLDEELPDI